MEIVAKGGLGDELAMTALVREYHRAWPDEMIRVLDSGRPELWDGNPHINRGNGYNGLRVRPEPLKCTAPGSLPRKYAAQLQERTGIAVTIVDDTPEIFLTDAELAKDFGTEPRGIAVDPWAFNDSRRWNYERFRELTRRLLAEGYYVYEVGRRTRTGAELRAPLPCTKSFFNMLTLRETAALIARCASYVGNDSGLFHLAAAVDTPQVVMFGAWRPADRAYSTTFAIEADSTCARACGRRCARRADGARSFCMDEITVDEVFRAVTL